MVCGPLARAQANLFEANGYLLIEDARDPDILVKLNQTDAVYDREPAAGILKAGSRLSSP
jgi:hypothetical protein